jgi:hypothetical protein
MATYIRHLRRAALVATLVTVPTTASAQLDPLLFLKTTQPNVIIAVETANRMQRDADSVYYDPGTWQRTGALYEPTIGLASGDATKTYYRKYVGLTLLNQSESGGDKFAATRIETVGDLEPGYATFFERTRLGIARRGLIRAITDNATSARFALIKTRQGNPTLGAAGNEGPVTVADPNQQIPTDLGVGKWKITRTVVSSSNSGQTVSGLLTAADAVNANTTILTTLGKSLGTAGALLPGGSDAKNTVDAPVGLLLDDARAHANTLITADTAAGGCRNTVVVLVVGGGEGSITPQSLPTKANTFLNVGGRRVPIYVIALMPAASEVSDLQAVASNSGGQYFEITKELVESTTAGDPVPAVVRAINLAVQHAFISQTLFNEAPTVALPFGPTEEHQVTSPIVGTVNLRGASKLTPTGTQLLPDSETYIFNGTAEIPQRSNVLVTSAFGLPGFEAKLRAFRVYRPEPASTPSGYKFVQDGSRLWVSSAPAAASRNIFTVLPGSTTMVPFTAARVNDLDDYLLVNDPETLIEWVRQQPLGAVVGSTPAFLDIPSLDPPPDDDYPGFREENKNRRAMIFYGGNDGMMHAIDARTGLEVWAFVPFNLLPKLRALRSGQSIDAFNYFVDSSPKISDVKVGADWRTFIFFGQGPGGTFYNTLDVTLDNIEDTVSETSTSESALLGYFSAQTAVKWVWSFPRLTSFDPTRGPYGELSAAASVTEQSVGETWSDPAIGQIGTVDGPFVMITGSGFLKYSTQSAYRADVARAGTTFYVLDVATGAVLGTPRDVGADAFAETIDDCRAINDCRKMKNALQMDPVATGRADERYISKVYIGDLDGNVWRFALSMTGTTVAVATPTRLYNTGAEYPLFSSMATVNVGGSNQYIFVGTGSDMLPSHGVNQSYGLLVLLDNGSSASKTAEILLERTDSALTGGDEKVSAFPAVAGDIVFFTTTTHMPGTPCTPFTANLYAFTFIGGPAYDTNNDGFLSTGTTGSTGGGKKGGGGSGSAPADSTKVFSQAGARATAPFIVDQHLVFATSKRGSSTTGDPAGTIQMFGDPEDFNNGVGQAGVRILSWRSVR